NAASLQFYFRVLGTSSLSMSAPRLCVGEETSYVATNHTAVESPSNSGPLALPYPAALDSLDPARGWLAVRFRSFAGTATVWEWRADDDNALALTVTPTDIAFTRTTDGADDTVTVPRPAGQSNDGSD